MKTYYYYIDSEAGVQHQKFEKLSEIISFIEEFDPVGDSIGTIYRVDSFENDFTKDNPIVHYISTDNELDWRNNI